MQYLDTNDSFAHMWYIWRFVGIHPPERLRWLYNVYAVGINLTASVTSPILAFINVFFLDDVGLIMHNLQTSLTLIVSSLKQLVIFLKISDLQRVRQYLNKLDRRARNDKEELQFLQTVVKQTRLMAVVIETSFSLSLLSYAIPGLIKGRLVFDGWFPFDWTSSVGLYAAAYTFQLLATAFQIAQNAANDAFAPMYINVLKGHIRALCMRIARIGKDPSTTVEENYQELKSCVKDHKNIISLFELITPVIGLTVLIQFSITVFVLCVTLVHFLYFNRAVEQLANTGIYLIAIFCGTFPVCYFGNALMSETDDLTTAIYSCKWMDQPMKFRKCLVIFMQRSQKTNVIMAGLLTVTLQTFVAIVRFSSSVFAVLSQMQ